MADRTAHLDPYCIEAITSPPADEKREPPAVTHAGTVVAIATETVLIAVFVSAAIFSILAGPAVAVGSVIAILMAGGGTTLAIVGICSHCRVLVAVKGLTEEELSALWDANVKEIRPGGESSVDGVIQAQLVPCLLARTEQMAKQLQTAGSNLSVDGVQEVLDWFRQAIYSEFARQDELAFTARMKYCSMDDFFVLADYEARRKLGLGEPTYAGQRFNCISFAGGGAKGIGYMAVLYSLMAQGSDVIDPDPCFTGSSAGALMAITGAFGISDINKVLRGITAMRKACQKFSSSASLERAYASFSSKLRGGFSKCLKALEIIDMTIIEQVQTFLRFTEEPDLAVLTADERARIEQLRLPIDMNQERERLMVTFRDIATLRKLRRGKEFFHELSISSWDCEHNRTVHFNLANTPDLPIPYAGRISISIPGYFSTFRGNPESIGRPADSTLPLEEQSHFYDGGIEQSAPKVREAFAGKEDIKEIYVLPDGDGSAYRKENRTDFGFSVVDWWMRTAGITGDLDERRKEIWKHIRSNVCLITPHSTVNTLQFKTEKFKIAASKRQSLLACLRTVVDLRSGRVSPPSSCDS
ncbi:MAG: hypothetical protein LBB14_00755 [Puniceicoccales bacterium]|jgi:predicted acylesterase/phospholipase RssA|nr:hypothetical protein [Puniceicoccales bacterium]